MKRAMRWGFACAIAALILWAAACSEKKPLEPSQKVPPGGEKTACSYYRTCPTTGTIRLGVARVAFTDLPLPSGINDAFVENLMFTGPGNVRDLYREMSYGQIDFSYTMFDSISLGTGWNSNCDGNASDWACTAIQELLNRQVNIDSYDLFVFVFPDGGCDRFIHGVSVAGARSALIFAPDDPAVYAHEIGHALAGMDDAKRGTIPYGDGSDIMGKTTMGLRHLNAPHKDHVGWLSAANVLTWDEVANHAENAIKPLTLPSTEPMTVKIPQRNGGGSYYYLSYRIDQGYDAALTRPDPDDGVVYVDRLTVHLGLRGGETTLLALLNTDDPYTSPGGEFTVRQTSVNDTEAKFVIDIPVTDFTPPSAPVPSSSVTCEEIHLTWTASVDEPGGSGLDHYEVINLTGSGNVSLGSTTELSMDIPAAYGQSYNFWVKAYDAAGNVSAGQLQMTMPPPEATLPSVPIQLTAQAPYQWVNLHWHASTDNCPGPITYEIMRVDAGIIASLSTTSYTDNSTAPTTMYTYKVRAVDVAGNRSAWSSGYRITTGEIYIEQP